LPPILACAFVARLLPYHKYIRDIAASAFFEHDLQATWKRPLPD